MEAFLQAGVDWLLAWMALPAIGLSAVFLTSLISATLLPMGSEPVLFGYVKAVPSMFWVGVIVATAGNTAGGAISYAMGLGAKRAAIHWRRRQPRASRDNGGPQGPNARSRWHRHAVAWLERFGPKAMLLSWLPGVGDPLCAVAGWLRFAFWPSVFYMAVGKFLRYAIATAVLLWLTDSM